MARLDLLEPQWRRHGMSMQLAAAALERAHCLQLHGQVAHAGQVLQSARAALPTGEPLPALHRPVARIQALVRDLEAAATGTERQADDWDGEAKQGQQPWIEVRTLGRFAVCVGGAWMPEQSWKGRRSKTLLKLLVACGGRAVPIERLCDALWPEADGAQARQNLKVALWRLRRLDGSAAGDVPRWIYTQHGTVFLDGRWCSVDALALSEVNNQLAAAGGSDPWARLAAYEGDFLPDDDGPVVLACRERLRREFVAATLAAAQQVLAGAVAVPPQCLPCVERAATLQPATEAAYEFLMALYLKDGRPADAMMAYLRAERALGHWLGAAPGQGLNALREAAGQAIGARPNDLKTTPTPPSAPAHRSPPRSPGSCPAASAG